MIPAEAVEAAARVMLDKMYDDKTLKVDDEDRDIMRAALEAAAPYMQAEFEKRWKYDALDSIYELGSDTTQFQRKTPHGND